MGFDQRYFGKVFVTLSPSFPTVEFFTNLIPLLTTFLWNQIVFYINNAYFMMCTEQVGFQPKSMLQNCFDELMHAWE